MQYGNKFNPMDGQKEKQIHKKKSETLQQALQNGYL